MFFYAAINLWANTYRYIKYRYIYEPEIVFLFKITPIKKYVRAQKYLMKHTI